MITRPRQRLARPVLKYDDSGSMLLALFAIMILTSLISVVLMVTISQQAKTRKAADFTFAGQAANTAVNDALLMANKNGAPLSPESMSNWDRGVSVPGPDRQGVTGDFRWTWWWDSREVLNTPTTMEIHATGCRNNPATSTCKPNSTRSVTATLSGFAVKEVADGGFALDPYHSFNRALFADKDLILRGNTTVTSYNSTGGPGGYGQVGTNGLATMVPPNVHVDGIYFSDTQTVYDSNRCSGSDCNPGKVRLIRPRLQVSDTSFVDPKPPLPGNCSTDIVPVGWVASVADGKLEVPTAGHACYSSLTFDADTTVYGGATATSPVEVFVTGPVTVGAGVKVNMNVSAATPASSRLLIFSSGTVVSIATGAAPATATQAAWALWAPNALCSTSGAGHATVYGSMVCQKISVQGTFTAKWDEDLSEGLKALATEHPEVATVWDITGIVDGA